MFNEIEGKNDGVAITTFKAGLLADHDLRKSLTGKPVTSVHQLMDRIDKYRKVKVIPQERRDFRSDRYNNSQPRRDFVGQSGSADAQVVNAVFREPVQQVLEKIKNESFFKWPNKMAGEPRKRNSSLYCHYH